MMDDRLVESFVAVLEERGFAHAAKRLCITQSAVSLRIHQLEETAGCALIIRDNPPRPTPAGERLLMHDRQVLELESEANRDIGTPLHQGFRHLPIAVSADCLHVWLFDAIAPFLKEASIALELFIGDQDNNLHHLQSGKVVGCVSSQRLDIQGFKSTRIGPVRYVLACAPDYQARWFPEGFTRVRAAVAPVIHYDREDLLQKRALRKALGRPPLEPPALYIPSAEKFNEAVYRGLGYGCIPDLQALPAIREGRLVELCEAARLNTAVYWYRWNRPSRLLETFSDILVTNGRRILETPG